MSDIISIHAACPFPTLSGAVARPTPDILDRVPPRLLFKLLLFVTLLDTMKKKTYSGWGKSPPRYARRFKLPPEGYYKTEEIPVGFFFNHPELPPRVMVEPKPGKKRTKPPLKIPRKPRNPLPKLTESVRAGKRGHFCGRCLTILRGPVTRLTWARRLIASEEERTRWDNIAEVSRNTKRLIVRCALCRPSDKELLHPVFYELLWEMRRAVVDATYGSELEPEVTKLREEVLPTLRANLSRVPERCRPHPVEDHWRKRILVLGRLAIHLEAALDIDLLSSDERKHLLLFFHQDFDL